MSRRWSESSYPFKEKHTERGSDSYAILVSNDGWIEYHLTSSGWSVTKEGQGGGITSEGSRTVVQVARDSEASDAVLATTHLMLESDQLSDRGDKLRMELEIAHRAVNAGKI